MSQAVLEGYRSSPHRQNSQTVDILSDKYFDLLKQYRDIMYEKYSKDLIKKYHHTIIKSAFKEYEILRKGRSTQTLPNQSARVPK